MRWISAGLILASLVIGWWIPEFYDWTGADQSRPAPVIPWIAFGIILADILAIALLLRYRIKIRDIQAPLAPRFHVTIWHLLIATTVIAGLLVVGRAISSGAAAHLTQGCALLLVLWQAYRIPDLRPRLAPFMFCMFAPNIWILRPAGPTGMDFYAIAFVLSVPAFLPATLVRFVMQIHLGDQIWIPAVLTAAELVVGTWVCRLGGHWSLIASLLALTISTFSTFLIHALVRM